MASMDYDDLMRVYKTPGNAADKLGVTRACISYWRWHGIPMGRQALIQLITRGRLRAADQATVPQIRERA